jgi:hypothetical protein
MMANGMRNQRAISTNCRGALTVTSNSPAASRARAVADRRQ